MLDAAESMARLPALSTEIIVLIAEGLSAADLFSLRRTCRTIKLRTSYVFIRRFFSTRYVMLERQSLDALVHIAEDPVLGPAVRTLGLCTEHLGETRFDDEDVGEHAWFNDPESPWISLKDAWFNVPDQNPLEARRRAEYQRGLENQEDFLAGDDVRYLTRAMKSMRNCKTLLLTDARIPWGSARLKRRVGSDLVRGLWQPRPRRPWPSDDRDTSEFVNHVLDAMLRAAAASDLQVEELSIDLGDELEPDKDERTARGDPIIPSNLNMPPGYIRTLPSLKSLRLFIEPEEHERPTSRNRGVRATIWAEDLGRFVKLFPALSTFYLSHSYCSQDSITISGLSKLSFASGLRELHVWPSSYVTVEDLSTMLLRHQSTLRYVNLQGVGMYGSRSWPKFLANIQRMPRLRRLTIHHGLIADSPFCENACNLPNIFSMTSQDSFAEVITEIENGMAIMSREDPETIQWIDQYGTIV